MNTIVKNDQSFVVIDKENKIDSVQDILDMMASARYHCDCSGIIIYKESLNDDFFDLKTRFAGEILQKFSNYRMRLAIIGDFSIYTSKSLRDFIHESNNGNLVFFKSDIEKALESITFEKT
ncbi:MAG: DUF4180 domain-containing protein [Saccharofermentanales bacterium]